MVNPRHAERHARHGEAKKAKRAQQAAAAETNSATAAHEPAAASNNQAMEDDALNMPPRPDLAEALAAVVREATKENLEALLTAADGDVTTLLNLAAAAQANPSPSTLLLATALHRIHQFVETSWDDTFAANAASTSAHLTQWEHLGSLFTRVATLEQRAAHPGTANMSPAQPHTQDALAARCDALEAQVASLRRELEMATRSSSTDEAGDDRQRLYARIKHVNDMRREAEMMRSEMLAQQRSDRVATLAVDVKTLQGRVDVSEHDMERTDARAGLHRQFEIAYLEGEITKEQYVQRLRSLDFC